jgi:hypothetical protein
MKQKVTGFYHAHGYNVWLMEGGDVVRELYSAGNSPYDSTTMVPIERGESIGTLAEWCEQTGSELAEDIGAIDRNASWPATYIDWEAAADSLKADYSSIDFNGEDYWIRSY